nr:MAG TPA: Putative transferase, nesg, ydcK, Structural Genomics.38A [Caudoviricetes sp.]
MANKYIILQNDSIQHEGRTLYRIKALRSFKWVTAGDIGGYVESERNLSQSGTCWVFDDAKVFDKAIVRDEAEITNEAQVFDNAIVEERSIVEDQAKVYGYANLRDDSMATGHAEVYEYARLSNKAVAENHAKVYGHARVEGEASVRNFAEVYGNARVTGYAFVDDDAKVYGRATVDSYARIYEHASVKDNGIVRGYANLSGYATVSKYGLVSDMADVNFNIQDQDEYAIYTDPKESKRFITAATKENWFNAKGMTGTKEEFLALARKESPEKEEAYRKIVDLHLDLYGLK